MNRFALFLLFLLSCHPAYANVHFESLIANNASTIQAGSSNIEGGNVAINSTGATTVSGSRIKADKNLNIKAGQLNVLAVNDSSYEEDRESMGSDSIETRRG